MAQSVSPISRSRSTPRLVDAEARHVEKVNRVARELKAHDAGKPLSLRKKAVSHQVPKKGDGRRLDTKLDISDLDEILEIDTVAQTCTVEPGVTFEKLAEATLRHGLVPTVVPELRTITVGGAVSGCSLESMSFRYGGFHDSCIEYEVITTEGQVLVCTPGNEHRLVFGMIHSSFGTLGVLSKVKFRLVPAKPYVKLEHETYPNLQAFDAAIRRHSAAGDVDFMDGIIHSPTKWVLCVGRFVAHAPYTHRYDWTRVYWQSTGTRKEDYLRTTDYFFRYDRGVTNVHPRSFLGRLLLGPFLTSERLLRIGHGLSRFLSADKPTVTVDLFMPASRTPGFMSWYEKAIGHFPLWCVPYKRVDYEWIADGYLAGIDDDLFLDIAIYGLEQPPGRNYYKELETALFEARGIKTLISHNYYDVETFWKIWNKPNYEAVKRITDPRNILRGLYEKTCRVTQGLT